MFKKLIRALQSVTHHQDPFDPAQFEDPLALQIEWTPANPGGANFKTHTLIEVDSHRIELRVSIGAKLFYSFFLFAGLAVLIGFSAKNISSGEFSFDMNTMIPLFIGLVFALVGGGLFFGGTRPIIFDKHCSCFWKGRKSPNEVFNNETIKECAKFENIHALQLISEHCRGNKSSYYSYELNLILNDGSRMNVIDHGNKKELEEDAMTLSAFLDKPVWDAISH